MRILIVSRYKGNIAGNVVTFVAEQCASLKDAGCDVELFLLHGNYFMQWKSLRMKIREFQPDVIHAHYGLSGLVANLATRRIPVVCTYHGSDINVPKVRLLSQITIRLSAWNIFVSKRNMVLTGVIEGKKCSLIPCGVAFSKDQLQSRVEARNALGWRASEKKVLFAGAFDNAVKNPELARSSVEIMDNVQLIELKGYNREQVNTLMCAVGCILLTSKTEGSPQVIKEAMACGCPIVSVDVGDVAERTNGLEGCYVVPSRAPKDVASALEKALAFEGKTKGRDRIIAEGLTNEHVAKKIISIYGNLTK